MSWFLAPFEYDFFLRGLVAGALVGAMCGALGVFVVLRRMSYIGHGLSQSVLGGVAVALLLGQGVYLGAAAATLVSAAAISWIGRQRGLNPDAGIGIVSTTLFAAGVVVISANRGLEVNLGNLLFGNVLGVDSADLAVLLAVAGVIAVGLFTFLKPLVFATDDAEVASAQGVRTGVLEMGFQIAVAAVVVASVRVVGVLLIAAALVIPAATVRLIARSFGPLILGAAGLGTATAVVGLYFSYHANTASGPSIVLSAATVFVVVVVATALAARGRTRRARRQHAARTPPG